MLFPDCCPSWVQLWHSPSSNLHSNKPLSLPVHSKQMQKYSGKEKKKEKVKKNPLKTKKEENPLSHCCRQQHHTVLFRNTPGSSLRFTHFFCPRNSNKKVFLKPHYFDVVKPLSDPDYVVTCHQGSDDLYISCGQFIPKCILCKSDHSLIAPSSGFFCHLLFQL